MDTDLPDINLRDQFLISMPHMTDQLFSHTLIYICEHDEQGAMGLVINQPMDLHFKDILGQLDIQVEGLKHPQMSIYAGGPVQVERGFVLHTPAPTRWLSTHTLNERLMLSTSLDILKAIALGEGPRECLIALGYSGWGAGQLEREMSLNAWLSCPADLDILFAVDASKRLSAAAASLGVNLDLLSTQIGHA